MPSAPTILSPSLPLTLQARQALAEELLTVLGYTAHPARRAILRAFLHLPDEELYYVTLGAVQQDQRTQGLLPH